MWRLWRGLRTTCGVPMSALSFRNFQSLDVDQFRQTLAKLHEAVGCGNGRIEVTRNGCNDVCVLISKSELEALEQALEILAQSAEYKAMCDSIQSVARRVRRLPAAGGRAANRNRITALGGDFRFGRQRRRDGAWSCGTAGVIPGALAVEAGEDLVDPLGRTSGGCPSRNSFNTAADAGPIDASCAAARSRSFQSSAFRSATTALIRSHHLRRRPRRGCGAALHHRHRHADRRPAAQRAVDRVAAHTAAQGRAVPQGQLDFVRRAARPAAPSPPDRRPCKPSASTLIASNAVSSTILPGQPADEQVPVGQRQLRRVRRRLLDVGRQSGSRAPTPRRSSSPGRSRRRAGQGVKSNRSCATTPAKCDPSTSRTSCTSCSSDWNVTDATVRGSSRRLP